MLRTDQSRRNFADLAAFQIADKQKSISMLPIYIVDVLIVVREEVLVGGLGCVEFNQALTDLKTIASLDRS